MKRLLFGTVAAALCAAVAEDADLTWSDPRTVASDETVRANVLTVAGDGVVVTNEGTVGGSKLILREGAYVQKSGSSQYAVSTVVGNGYDTAATRELTGGLQDVEIPVSGYLRIEPAK